MGELVVRNLDQRADAARGAALFALIGFALAVCALAGSALWIFL
jgi:hypothetical protein